MTTAGSCLWSPMRVAWRAPFMSGMSETGCVQACAASVHVRRGRNGDGELGAPRCTWPPRRGERSGSRPSARREHIVSVRARRQREQEESKGRTLRTLLAPEPSAVAQKTSAVARRLEYSLCSSMMNLRQALRYLPSISAARMREESVSVHEEAQVKQEEDADAPSLSSASLPPPSLDMSRLASLMSCSSARSASLSSRAFSSRSHSGCCSCRLSIVHLCTSLETLAALPQRSGLSPARTRRRTRWSTETCVGAARRMGEGMRKWSLRRAMSDTIVCDLPVPGGCVGQVQHVSLVVRRRRRR